jgi:hypothetical protein
MRTRFVLLVAAILLVAGFAAMNWSEVIRPVPLLFGTVVREAPLGAILLGLLALAVVVFVVTAASLRTAALLEKRQHYRDLEAQRALADKAEGSRIAELRDRFDTHARELHEREAIAAAGLEKARLDHQREIRVQLEQINRTLSARLNELEHRLEARFERMGYGGRAAPQAHPSAMAESVPPRGEAERAQAMADEEDAQPAQERDERLLEGERRRDERAQAGDRPAGSGWRRWF